MVGEFQHKGGTIHLTHHYILHDKKSIIAFKDIKEIHQSGTDISIKDTSDNEIKFKKMKSNQVSGCYLVLIALWQLNNPNPINPLLNSPEIQVPEWTQQGGEEKLRTKNIVAALTGIQQHESEYRVIVKNKAIYSCCVANLQKQTLRILTPQKDKEIKAVKYGDVSSVTISDVPLQIIVREKSGTSVIFLMNKVVDFVKDLKQRCTEAELVFDQCASEWCDVALLKSELESMTSKLMKIPVMGMYGSLPKMPKRSTSDIPALSQNRTVSMDLSNPRLESIGLNPFAGATLRSRSTTKVHVDGPLENVIKTETKEAISDEGELIHLAASRARGPPRKRRPAAAGGQKKKTTNLQSVLKGVEEEER